jgi:hypothetical protein
MSAGRLPRSLRWLASAACAAAVCGLSPAIAATSASSYLPLAGTTTVPLTSPTSSQLVSLPKAVVFGGLCEPEPLVSVSGTADAVVLALVPVGVASPTPILFGRLPKAEGDRTFSTLCGNGAAIPAGKYKLVALRAAGTATATLHLPGLRGHVRLAPHRAAVPATLARLDPVQPYAPTSGAASFAATHPLVGKGFVMVIGWNRVQSDSALVQGDCEASGAETTLPLVATEAPGCPLGSGASNVPTAVGPGENYWAGGESNVAADTYSAGYFVVTGQAPATAGALGLWVPFSV